MSPLTIYIINVLSSLGFAAGFLVGPTLIFALIAAFMSTEDGFNATQRALFKKLSKWFFIIGIGLALYCIFVPSERTLNKMFEENVQRVPAYIITPSCPNMTDSST